MIRASILLAAFSIFTAKSAFCADYNVTVRQLNPEGPRYTNNCRHDGSVCHVFMGIALPQKNGSIDDIELDIGILFREETAYLQFKSGWDYFFVSQDQNYAEFFLDQTETKKAIKLFSKPLSAEQDPVNSLRRLPVMRDAEPVAELEISIKPYE